MGCGASKLEAEDELPPGLRPIRRKIEEVKRRRRRSRYSIVSTTELLCPEDDRDGPAADAEGSSRKVKASAVAPEPEIPEEEEVEEVVEEKPKFEAAAAATAAEEKEEEARKVGKGTRVEGAEDEEEVEGEMLGSPSFRFYFVDAVRDSDDDSVKLAGFQGKEKLEEIKEKDHEREEAAESVNPNEDSESKQVKKEKPKKLRALTKAPSAVRNLFNVRNCYSNPSSDTNNVNHPRLLTGTSA
ncbi:nucleolin-like isoform X2 [Ananas comosus]|uniref:Nucleolin-like isoform X2 n=1 Tax=Ananas comosus TaxID=4615 RepID=A0A6P5FYI2_ANACO|nr:nucleolin-like isoform X2 [Ananas comosus]